MQNSTNIWDLLSSLIKEPEIVCASEEIISKLYTKNVSISNFSKHYTNFFSKHSEMDMLQQIRSYGFTERCTVYANVETWYAFCIQFHENDLKIRFQISAISHYYALTSYHGNWLDMCKWYDSIRIIKTIAQLNQLTFLPTRYLNIWLPLQNELFGWVNVGDAGVTSDYIHWENYQYFYRSWWTYTLENLFFGDKF